MATSRRISEGPLFRPVAKGGRLGAERLTDQSVCSIVKAYAERIGLKAAEFGAHLERWPHLRGGGTLYSRPRPSAMTAQRKRQAFAGRPAARSGCWVNAIAGCPRS
jgi:hypothetical protein